MRHGVETCILCDTADWESDLRRHKDFKPGKVCKWCRNAITYAYINYYYGDGGRLSPVQYKNRILELETEHELIREEEK